MVTLAPDLSLGSVAVTLYHSKSMETSPITSLHTVESSDSGWGAVNILWLWTNNFSFAAVYYNKHLQIINTVMHSNNFQIVCF